MTSEGGKGGASASITPVVKKKKTDFEKENFNCELSKEKQRALAGEEGKRGRAREQDRK